MNMKKILIAIMVLAMIFAFSACGEDSESPDNDATEIEEQDGDGKGCLLYTSYEYEGEILPEDFICPVCKHSASYFEKITN